jgi:prophage regulatory protein
VEIKFLRYPDVCERRGDSRATMLRDIELGLWTPAIHFGKRACWPAHECEAIMRARFQGKKDDEVRALVAELVAARKAPVERVPEPAPMRAGRVAYLAQKKRKAKAPRKRINFAARAARTLKRAAR